MATILSGDGQPPRMSALTTKITTILSSSLASIEIRDALTALDARHTQNTAITRRNLRLDLQAESISANAEIIHDFGHVASQLRSVGTALTQLQATVAEMRRHVSAAKLETAPMLDEADDLLAKQAQVDEKKQLLNAFSTHFVLTEAELLALTSTAEPIDTTFFAALVKGKRIHKDSQILLSTSNQGLGLEILEQSSKHLNAAFQKLYRWVQREFKSLDLENPQLNSGIRRAVRVLAERPALFQSVLDVFAESRERSLEQAFYAALTGHGVDASRRGSEMQKPIEFSMHEPLRYVGDMLAWVHSTAVSERETLEGLFVSEGDEIARGIKEGLESEPWNITDDDDVPREAFDGRKALGQLVDSSLTGAAQLLRQRVDQVVESQDDAVLAYKVFNLIAFYRNIFTRLVETADLLTTLDTMQTNALTHFRSSMRMHVTSISDTATIPSDLSAPTFLTDALSALQSLLISYETSAASASASDDALIVVLDEALNPFTGLCEHLANALEMPGSAVFMVNVLQVSKAALHPFRASTATAIEDIDSSIVNYTGAISQNLLHDFMLTSSGLSTLLAAVRTVEADDDLDMDGPRAVSTLLRSPEWSQGSLQEAAQRLDTFLPSAISDAEDLVRGLRDKRLLGEVVGMAAEVFREVFGEVVEWVEKCDELRERPNGDGGEGDEQTHGESLTLREIFPRTTEEVGILLS